MDSYEWLAGLLEGEGSFLKGSPSRPWLPRVLLSMTDEDIVRRAADLTGVQSIHKHEHANPDWKPAFILQLSGQRAVDLMTRIRPLMGKRRQVQIDQAVACWNPLKDRNKDRDAEIMRLYATKQYSYADIGRLVGMKRQATRGVIRRRIAEREPRKTRGA